MEGQIRAFANAHAGVGVEMVSQGAGEMMKTGLPQYSVVQQPFDESHFRKPPGLLPGIGR
jgi:hypothetical protein